MPSARDEVLGMLRGSAGADVARPEPTLRDEVLSMLRAEPPSGGLSLPSVPAALSGQASRMGRFFTEGLPRAARTTYEGMQRAATAPTFGQSLMRRSRPEPVFGGPPTSPGYADRIVYGAGGAAADLAERFMGMAAAVGRGAGMLGPLATEAKPDPLTEAAVNAALPFAPTLVRGARATFGRGTRAPMAPALPPDPLAGDASGLRPGVARPALPPARPEDLYYEMGTGPRPGVLALPPAPREVTNPPIPQPPIPPSRRPYAEPPPEIRGTRVAPPEESLLIRRPVEPPRRQLEAAEEVAFRRAGGDPTAPPEMPTRLLDAQGRPILEARPGFRRPGGAPPSAPEPEIPVLEAPAAPAIAAEARPVAPTRPKPPEPPPELSLAIQEPRPPRAPRAGETTAGANPAFADAQRQWQQRLAQIDYGTVSLSDPDEVRAFIKGVGGIRPGPDYPDLPFFFKNAAGRPIDEIVQEIANAQGKPVKAVERQLTDTLMRYQSLQAEKRARPSAPPETGAEPPTMQAWEERVRADPESAYPDWLRGVVPPIPLPDLPPEEQDTTKGRLYRALQIAGLAAPAIGMAASRFGRGRQPGTPRGAPETPPAVPETPAVSRGTIVWREGSPSARGFSGYRSADGRFQVQQTTPDTWMAIDRQRPIDGTRSFPTFQAARQWAERQLARGVGEIPRPPAFERGPLGDQAIIPGAEGRAVPDRPVSTERAQRPVEELPLFGQEKAARQRAADTSQRSLFDYLTEERGALFPDRSRSAGAVPPALGSRPPEVPAAYRSERVGGGTYRPPVEEPPATTPSVEPAAPTPLRPEPTPREITTEGGALRGFREAARQFYSPILSQFERMGEFGKEAARRIQRVESQAQQWYGRHVEPLVREGRRLSDVERTNFRLVLEEGAPPVTPRVAALLERYDAVFGPGGLIPREARGRNFVVIDQAGEARPFTPRQNFFPHEFTPEMVREIRARGPAYDRALKHLLDTGQAADAETAGVMLAERFGFKRTTIGDRIFLMDPDRFVGGLERSRDVDLPGYIEDPAAAIGLRGYKVARRLAEVDHYGRLDAEIGAPGGYLDPMTGQAVPAHGLIGEIQRTQGRDAANHAFALWQRALGHAEYAPHLAAKQAAARAVTSFEAFTKLPLAAIANASQGVQVAVRTNLSTAAKGLLASMTRSGREAARDLGVISDMSLRQLHEEVLGGARTPGRLMKVALGPFNAVEKWDRIVGANAGLSWARTLESRLAELTPGSRGASWMARELDRLTFSPDEVRGLISTQRAFTPEERGRIAWAIADQTQFIGRNYRRSEFFSSPLGSVIGQFKTFAINAGRLLKQNVVEEAKHGNFAPLARVAVLFPIAGEGVQDVKALVRGTERPDSLPGRLLDNAMAVGGFGLAADLLQQFDRAGEKGSLAWLVGPAFSDAADVGSDVYRLGKNLATGDTEKAGRASRALGRAALRGVPFVGPPLAEATREDPEGLRRQQMSVAERLRLP